MGNVYDDDDDDDNDNDDNDDDDNKSHFLWIYGCSLGSTKTIYSYKEQHIQSLLSWHINLKVCVLFSSHISGFKCQ